jgi:hypothetical protein
VEKHLIKKYYSPPCRKKLDNVGEKEWTIYGDNRFLPQIKHIEYM